VLKTEHEVIWYQTKLTKTLKERLALEMERRAIHYTILRDQAEEDEVCKKLGPELGWHT
jgi:hypothetical protein